MEVPDREVLPEVIRRDGELSSGVMVGLTHEEVMSAARRTIGLGDLPTPAGSGTPGTGC
jgi:hypothetical protein